MFKFDLQQLKEKEVKNPFFFNLYFISWKFLDDLLGP